MLAEDQKVRGWSVSEADCKRLYVEESKETTSEKTVNEDVV